MASKSRSRPARKKPGPNPLANLGLFDIPNIDMDANSDDDSEIDENDLESELEELLHGKLPSKRSKPKIRKAPAVIDIEKMAAACLEDDIEDDDENLSGDEDLLKELQNISSLENNEPPQQKSTSEDTSPTVSKNSSQETSQTSLLTERLALYNEAIIAAKSLNDTSKVRRYKRAVKTLENLLKSAKLGNPINEEDIPPVVSIPKKGMQPSIDPSVNIPDHVIGSSDTEIAAEKHTNTLDDPVMDAKQNVCFEDGDKCAAGFLMSEDEKEAKRNAILALLEERKNQYKIAAVQAKKAGNKSLAIEYLRTAKTFASVIEDTTGSRLCDIENIPPPPPGYEDSKNIQTAELTDSKKRTHEQVQTSSPIETAALAAAKEEEAAEIFAAPEAPTTVLEALQQRLEKYKTTREEAEASGNSGKVRRLKRIEKSYITAIKDYTSGKKEVDFESLPTPPGFAPIPVTENSKMAASKNEEHLPPKKSATPPKPVSHTSQAESDVPAARKPKIQRTNTAKTDRQLEFLLERQKLFRQAALSAKQNGDLQQAKEYLRMSKGFDSMIEATKCGLPIDASSIPTPPQLESSDFEIIDISECIENSDLNQDNLFETLQKDLCDQLEICARNKEHFFQLGDVSSASKFEKLALQTKKDLIVIQNLKKNTEAVPKFHYETRLFSMVLCHTDLADNHFEVSVERGINLPGKPEELDSYIKIEFPIPTDAPQRQKTRIVKDTNNPIFDEVFKFEFQRKSRSHLRLFKRHCLKLEVWSKGGFLRSDTLLGTVSVKLNDLESKCLLHDSYNLMDGRKACGGKLAVKIRIREPLLVKQVEEVHEKWLVIGS